MAWNELGFLSLAGFYWRNLLFYGRVLRMPRRVSLWIRIQNYKFHFLEANFPKVDFSKYNFVAVESKPRKSNHFTLLRLELLILHRPKYSTSQRWHLVGSS